MDSIDLLSQAEHDEDARAILVTDSLKLINLLIIIFQNI